MTRSPARASQGSRTSTRAHDDGLGAVRQALLDAARGEAARVVAAARAAADDTRARARDRADETLRRARCDGEAAAQQMLAVERARDRRDAQRITLAARRRAWEELRQRAGAAAEQLATAPDYPDRVARLADTARTRLGDAAVITVDGPEGPGVVAEAGNRRIDMRLRVLADRSVAELGTRVEELWR